MPTRRLIGDVTVFDVFAGGTLGDGKKSLAIEVTLNPREKTLTDEEIEAVSAKIVAQVQKATGGVLQAVGAAPIDIPQSGHRPQRF